MPNIRSEALAEVKRAFAQYEDDVKNALLSPDSKRTYVRHARTFVRWLDDDFEPGSKNRLAN